MSIFTFLTEPAINVEELEVTKQAKSTKFSPLMGNVAGESDDAADEGDAE